MRIGISINGQGRGHLTRMTALAQHLQNDHEIVFWCPDKYHSFLAQHFPNNFIYSIPYYRFVIEDNRIDVFKTGLSNMEHIVGLPVYISDLADQIRLMDIETLISDFEPFLPKAARKVGIPVIQLNHPAVVLRSVAFSADALLAKVISTSMMGEYDVRIISSFYNGDIGPIIRKEIRQAVPSAGDYFVVYLHESMRDKVLSELDRLNSVKYKVFPNAEEDFVSALAGARGVITNAGHQLLSETLHLKKPVLTLPFEGQFEQTLNAAMLQKAGRGIVGSMETIRNSITDYMDFTAEFDPCRESVHTGTRFCLQDDSQKALSLLRYHLHKHEKAS
ncbi:MAG: glycosyltransferase family protein [Spirochaetota bacterium]